MDGRLVPGISAVLRSAGLLEAMPEATAAMRRGTYAHLATELDDKGDLVEDELDPKLVPYLEAWRKCRTECSFRILAIEELVGNKHLRYATKVDRRVMWSGKETILNLKTGSAWPHYGIQMAGECQAYNRTTLRRVAVYLGKDGRYRLEEHKDRNDFEIFRAAVKIYWWRDSKCPMEKATTPAL